MVDLMPQGESLEQSLMNVTVFLDRDECVTWKF